MTEFAMSEHSDIEVRATRPSWRASLELDKHLKDGYTHDKEVITALLDAMVVWVKVDGDLVDIGDLDEEVVTHIAWEAWFNTRPKVVTHLRGESTDEAEDEEHLAPEPSSLPNS